MDGLELLTIFIFVGVACLLVLTLLLNAMMLVMIYQLRCSVEALTKVVDSQTDLIKYIEHKG